MTLSMSLQARSGVGTAGTNSLSLLLYINKKSEWKAVPSPHPPTPPYPTLFSGVCVSTWICQRAEAPIICNLNCVGGGTGPGPGPGSVDYQSRYTVCLRRPDVCRITFSILLWSRVLEFVHRGAALQVFSSHVFVDVVLIPFLCFSDANPFFLTRRCC